MMCQRILGFFFFQFTRFIYLGNKIMPRPYMVTCFLINHAFSAGKLRCFTSTNMMFTPTTSWYAETLPKANSIWHKNTLARAYHQHSKSSASDPVSFPRGPMQDRVLRKLWTNKTRNIKSRRKYKNNQNILTFSSWCGHFSCTKLIQFNFQFNSIFILRSSHTK